MKLPPGDTDANPILDFAEITRRCEAAGGTGGFIFIYQLDGERHGAIFQTNLSAEMVYTMLDDICEQMERDASAGVIVGDGSPTSKRGN